MKRTWSFVLALLLCLSLLPTGAFASETISAAGEEESAAFAAAAAADDEEDTWGDEENTWDDEEDTWSDEEDTWDDEEDTWDDEEDTWDDEEDTWDDEGDAWDDEEESFDISESVPTLSYDSCAYTGKARKPDVQVDLDDWTLEEGEDYTVAYSNNVNVGTATVTVTGTGIVTGTAKATFKIVRAANKITVKAGTAIQKSANAKKAQTVSLSASALGGAKLAYSCRSTPSGVKVNNKGKVTIPKRFAGKATITVTAPATKNYKKATQTVVITVVPAKTSLTSVKSGTAKKLTVTWKKAAGDITGYQLEVSDSKSFSNAKTFKIKGAAKLSKTVSNLTGGKTYYVRVRTYRAVGKTAVYSPWSAAKKATVKTAAKTGGTTKAAAASVVKTNTTGEKNVSSGVSDQTTVYVSRTGKIHTSSDCSGMKYYTKMTYSEAIGDGYTKCKKCF